MKLGFHLSSINRELEPGQRLQVKDAVIYDCRSTAPRTMDVRSVPPERRPRAYTGMHLMC
jgi:hypothetical protein